MGLEITHPHGHLDIGHGGILNGFTGEARYEPDGGLSIIVLSNLDGAATRITTSLVDIARGLPGILPPKPVGVPLATLQSYVGTYVISPEEQIVVTLENGELMAEEGVWPRMVLVAQSDTVFYIKPLGDHLEFVKGSDGGLSVIFHSGEPDQVGKRQ